MDETGLLKTVGPGSQGEIEGTPRLFAARLRPTGEADKVQVLWWNGERWGASGPFGIATMPLDKALDYIADEPAFWIHV